MARIVVTTAGTLGDLVPFLALARKLRSRGHDLTMAVNPTMVPRAERTGLRAVPCGHPYGPEQLGDSAEIVEGPVQVTLSQYREALQRLDLGRVYRDLRSEERRVGKGGEYGWAGG